jgi:hypothetical protein
LLYPNNTNFSGYDVDSFNFTINEGYFTNCELWGNWSGSMIKKQDLSPISVGVELNFSSENTGDDGYYGWRVRCNDTFGGMTWSDKTNTFSTYLPPDFPILINASQTLNNGNGNITLFWNSASHSERYRIYYTHSMNGNFSYLAETTALNFTDTNFSGNRRRFYRVDSYNPIGQNASSQFFGAHVYTLGHNGNTRNWIGFPTNASYLRYANETIDEIANATTFTMWNATTQNRVTCNSFTCPSFPSCTNTTCNFELSPGRGYEVNINSSAPSLINWSLVGLVYNPVTINLIKNSTYFGKNWIAMNANTTMNGASDILTNISNSDATTRWDPIAQTSKGLIHSPWSWVSYLGTNFSISIEEGYEVSVTTNTDWMQI